MSKEQPAKENKITETKKTYKEIFQGGTGEIVEKKSRFIATVERVETEEEAIAFIEAVKKKYWNARHHCFAFTIGANHEIQRCSDDGEPSGTGGKPILEVLLLEKIHHAVIVVTRYFGGTLLGTGGLVRAYGGAAKEGLRNSVIIEKRQGIKMAARVDYNSVGKLQHILNERKIAILDSIYTQEVEIEIVCPLEAKGELMKSLIEATSGKIEIKEGEKVLFATHKSEVLVF